MDTPQLVQLYTQVRRRTEALASPLSPEDQMVQSMATASPTKWHLAHTTWFFETFVLGPHWPQHPPRFPRLFNSYYESIGTPPDRGLRGALSRPSLDEVHAYRRSVDAAVLALLDAGAGDPVRALVVLGLNHEEQHQELILTDIKHAFGSSPLLPAYRAAEPAEATSEPPPLSWVRFEAGVSWVGHDGDGFAFDNELPRHRQLLAELELGSRLVTCGEYLAFMRDGGYQRPELWLSDGWALSRAARWDAPLYWQLRDATYWQITLAGERPVALDEPVVHVSYYEADAFARWAGARLPREGEWERAAAGVAVAGNLLESGRLHPGPARGPALTQLFGDAWEWTASPYVEYPGYRREAGALGEYNGKFMCNQMVLRGGSCVTPRGHLRASYRNFFPPDARWQFSGIRLARDVAPSRAARRQHDGAAAVAPADASLEQVVARGLTAPAKALPPWLLYDERGSALFEEITRLPEYYLARTEHAILAEHVAAMLDAAGPPLAVAELGAGSAIKTRVLLAALLERQLQADYYPVDVSPALAEVARELRSRFPGLRVWPASARYPEDLGWLGRVSGRRLVLFLGSSIGNDDHAGAGSLLRGLRAQLAPGDALLLGTDLVKPEHVLVPAYDDAAGVTARFNKNLLARLNRELDADFDARAFRHVVRWNPERARIELYLQSERAQRVTLRKLGLVVPFERGELLHTENSHKFTVSGVRGLLAGSGFALEHSWSDTRAYFALHLARAT